MHHFTLKTSARVAATALIFMMAGANDVNCNCHALTDSLEHGRGILQNGIRAQALEDVEVAFPQSSGKMRPGLRSSGDS